MSNRFAVDADVSQFFPVDATHVYVVGTDANLWNETGTSANRFQVDTNVAQIYGVNSQMVYVEGGDGNLWREVQTMTFRDHIDGNVKAFQPMGAAPAYVLGTNGNLWLEQEPAAPLVYVSGTNLLSATSAVGIWPNGNFVFQGSMTWGTSAGRRPAGVGRQGQRDRSDLHVRSPGEPGRREHQRAAQLRQLHDHGEQRAARGAVLLARGQRQRQAPGRRRVGPRRARTGAPQRFAAGVRRRAEGLERRRSDRREPLSASLLRLRSLASTRTGRGGASPRPRTPRLAPSRALRRVRLAARLTAW